MSDDSTPSYPVYCIGTSDLPGGGPCTSGPGGTVKQLGTENSPIPLPNRCPACAALAQQLGG